MDMSSLVRVGTAAVDVREILRRLEERQAPSDREDGRTPPHVIPVSHRFLYEPGLTPKRSSGWGA